MRIEATGPRQWSVIAYWLGAERPVHTGTIWDCLRYRAEHED